MPNSDQPEAETAAELATRRRIAKHNGVPLDQVPTAAQVANQHRDALVDQYNARLAEPRPPKTFEQKLITRLTLIAASLGFIAIVVAVFVIIDIASVVTVVAR